MCELIAAMPKIGHLAYVNIRTYRAFFAAKTIFSQTLSFPLCCNRVPWARPTEVTDLGYSPG